MNQAANCPNCGTPLSPGQQFCPACGASVGQAGQIPGNIPHGTPFGAAPSPGSNKNVIIIIVVIAGLALVIGLGFLLYKLFFALDVKPKDLNGTWKGTVTLVDTNDKDLEDDLDEDKKDTMTLDLDKDGEGTMDGQDVTYENGTLVIDFKESGVKISGELDLSEDDGEYVFAGDMEMEYTDKKKDEDRYAKYEIEMRKDIKKSKD